MKYFFYIAMIVCMLSCEEAVKKPAHILPEEKMSEIIADFAINDQSYAIGGNINTENATRFILKKYNIQGKLFSESYKYYLTKPDDLTEIMTRAQEIIKAKDPKAEAYINKKLKENPDLPAQAR